MLFSITPSTVEGALTRPLTAAEKKRAQKLKDDPLVTLLSPLWVECRRCGSKIKLSPKSTYDPFHWARHRERCLRRPLKIVEAMRQDAEEQVCLAYPRCQTAGDFLTLCVTPTLLFSVSDSFPPSRHRPPRRNRVPSTLPPPL